MCDICDNVSENGEQEDRLMERKYPQNWFWAFVFTNFLFHYFYLFVPGVLLCLVGIWVRTCLWIGAGVLVLDGALSILDQLRIRKTALTKSDNPEFNQLMDAFCGEGGLQAFGKVLEEKAGTSQTAGETEKETED